MGVSPKNLDFKAKNPHHKFWGFRVKREENGNARRKGLSHRELMSPEVDRTQARVEPKKVGSWVTLPGEGEER